MALPQSEGIFPTLWYDDPRCQALPPPTNVGTLPTQTKCRSKLVPEPESQTRQSAVLRALARVLRPLARLLIAGGVPIQAASESLKRAYVEAAHRHFGDEAATDSRLSLLTGINRKEVRRLTTPVA